MIDFFCKNIAASSFCDDRKFVLRLLFVLGTEHTLLPMFLNIWRRILILEDLHDAAL